MKSVSKNEEIYFLSGKRTPFGTYGGSLKDLSATDLAVESAKAALAQAGVSPELIEHVVYGNVVQTSSDAIYLPRHVGLRTGVPVPVPALGVNRLCGSGFQAFVTAAEMMLTGGAEAVLAGGTESMSQAPHVIRGARWGIPLGKGGLEDMLWTALTDSYTGQPMALTAEQLAVDYGLTQDDVDQYAVLTQKRFAAAQEAGRLADEIAPVTLKGKKGDTVVSKDEHNRPETTVEGLRKLPKVFKKDGVVHAGAASGICDGAGSMVMATRGFVEKHGLKPVARLVNWGVSGCDPKIMGIGPAPAIRNLLKRADAKLSDVDLFEVNEAFAPQYLAVEKELGLPRDATNVNGGAIAVGHPLGASGARITMTLAYELKRRGARYGIGSACIGGGQGIAVLVEAL
ncbi:acetyl-CoA C-acetyltransferase [Corallococcus sp. AB032C]|uniref:acetyl-CoA C-acetyltransferase n=1 Tax=Corallococcus TaxID=83461 RepID=UPI000EBA8332|nr:MULTISPECIES: acetyl-CoA C-acetyltransferase [Corallococcus]NPC48307.1 acetyl-CoA C-acetyltransferase [Corallococcus exiguus]NPC71286.1 acetyl-CoA C-acetyltransferase [Corallococcus exiguus]RKH78543.1 acetyl-CoA C-acetyltransferase [Corallococcus sp. AB032C]RKH98630.1 acetyl-CoA C-acetyltransferase [Corallococcus sp. AB038B]